MLVMCQISLPFFLAAWISEGKDIPWNWGGEAEKLLSLRS